MIDLSYLTEEEQEMIMAVLKRDAELKRAEEERVRQLQTLLPDKGKLKYMTGEWFYEAKSQRHLDRIHGSDIIRASMKQRRPMTLLDLTQSWTEKTSTASNGNLDIVIPEEPSVPTEEPPAEPKEERKSDVSPDPQPNRLKLALRSPAKQRHNPFNTAPVELEAPEDTKEQLNGAVELQETPEGDQHEYHVESRPPQMPYLLSYGDEKGKPVHTGMGGQEVLPKLATQSPEHTEEGGDSIAKVLEWFSRSINNNDRQDEDVPQKNMEESEGEPGLLEDDITPKTMTTGDVLTPEVESPKLRRLRKEMSVDAEDVSESDEVREQSSPAITQEDAPKKVVSNSREAQPALAPVCMEETPPSFESSSLPLDENEGPGKYTAKCVIIDEEECTLPVEVKAGVQTSPQDHPVAKKQEVSRTPVPQDSELDLSAGFGPVRASTPVASEESQVRKSSMGQRSWQSPRGPDDIEFDSYRSSTPETWSHSGASSACDDEDQNPVRLALKRAALKSSKPSMSSSKSVEDITALPTRKDRSKITPRRELMLSMDDVSAVPSFPTSYISESNQMKKMSKSVPSFLQKESDGRDSDSTSGSSIYSGRQMRMGSSFTNLSSSSGMASVSSASGSVMSIYSGDFGSVEVSGTIQFSLNYVQKLKEFHIFVVRCRDLAAVDTGRNRSNPYVKCYLLPDQLKLGKRKTSVKKKTLNPNFNEILRYRIRMETLKTQTLNVSVWHNDTFGRNSFLGEVEVDLSKWDFGNTQMNNFTLKPRTPSGPQPSEFRGEMRLALRFLPQITYSNKTSNTGEVHIWIKDCKDLPIIRGTSIDPFVKCFVLPDTSRKSRQKTRVLKRTTDPAFNHTMVYDGFRTEDLPEACVELTVWDHDRLANHFVGGLRLGLGTGKSYGAVVDWMDSNAAEASLWERMMDSPNEWVEDVLPLRMLTMAKNVWK
ncbi:hypothetical protein MATL_G00123460 [Megalops atlanticus]|uniref:Synaptotagmin-like protein 2 n=1 Tax=Megalops atlanticus TaxID=7932 RepID=A0A9D3Q1D4_MEGAT|nr:hypothetical protein MATL_G00123460 [Megalops atlanticus]